MLKDFKIMKRFTIFLVIFIFCLAVSVFSAEKKQIAAENLHALGLISGIGNNAVGSVNFDIDGRLTRV